MAGYTPDEMMTLAAARALEDDAYCFVGIGLPSAAANLARRLHAPGLMLVYESGTIGSKPDVLPLSIGDGALADTADVVVPIPEVFAYWLQGGRIDVGFLGAAQVDRLGNLNTTVIGPYDRPTVRLPGAGGAPEIAAGAREVYVMARHRRETFVERLDFVTTAGAAVRQARPNARPNARLNARLTPRGVTRVITDLAVLEPDPVDHELVLTQLHQGVAVADVRAATGWPLRVADALTETPPPTPLELDVLRDLQARTQRAHRTSPAAG